MCDYSLQNVRSRDAKVNDVLYTHDFRTGTRGFSAADDGHCAVCLKPGTEVAFPEGITITQRSFFGWPRFSKTYSTAIFRQVNRNTAGTHHDAVEFPDGKVVLLTALPEGQVALVLQLPAAPKTIQEAVEQRRVAFVG